MRVAIDVSAIPDDPAGAGTYVVELVRALDRLDDDELDLHLVAGTGDGARWQTLAPGATVHGVAPRSRPLRLGWEQARAPRFAARLGADLWHGPHYTMPLRMRGPTLVTIHDLTFFDHPEWHERAKVRFFRPMIRASARRAAALVCVSDRTAERLRDLLAPAIPVLAIPHGVDHDRFRATGDADADLDLLATNGIRPPYVAFVGTLEPRKNVPSLVRAFDRIAGDRPDLQLVLAGGRGWGGAEVGEAVGTARHGVRILRTGYVAAELVPALLRRALAVVYPSFDEGFGLPALEALACGAPVITTEGTPMAEVVGDAGVLVPVDDDGALAAALGALVDDESRREALAAAGPAKAAPFTWERCAADHVAAYRATTAQAGR